MNARWRELLRSGTFVSGMVIVAFWAGCALCGRLVVPFDPFQDDILNTLSAPSGAHWFGTDQLGRDVFSRVIVGARDILLVAPLATALGIALGVMLGLVTGYFRGLIDDVIGRAIDALLALPLVIIALLALTAMGTSTATVIVVIGIIFAPLIARTVRAAVLSERDLDYVAAARLRNEHTVYILFVEILPNVMPPIVVEATVRLGYAIFTVATLSFIGFGIQPPSPDWGLAVSESYGLINGGIWWPVLFNTLAIASLVIGVNLAADGVQSAVDA
ncbi:MAG TPA: ABC transporter permease [Steroidobacteraceae bacterium]|jgi:peptide/nickel transport system permease protein|nr:ABC transporter permease [Steroidobacteraceae bacterium]